MSVLQEHEELIEGFTRAQYALGKLRETNEIFDFNPSAENIARWICDQVENAYKVEIWESENNKAIYERDED